MANVRYLSNEVKIKPHRVIFWWQKSNLPWKSRDAFFVKGKTFTVPTSHPPHNWKLPWHVPPAADGPQPANVENQQKPGNLRIFYKQLSLMESPLWWTASAQLHLRFFSICLRTEAMQATLFCVFLCPPEDRCTSYVAKWGGMLRLSVPPKRKLRNSTFSICGPWQPAMETAIHKNSSLPPLPSQASLITCTVQTSAHTWSRLPILPGRVVYRWSSSDWRWVSDFRMAKYLRSWISTQVDCQTKINARIS